MFAICTIVKQVTPGGMTSMITQIVAGVFAYIGILLIRKDEYLYMFIDKIKKEVLKIK